MPLLIVTTEKSGVDRYSKEIAQRLDVRTIESRRYLSLIEAYQLSRLLGSQDDIIHLPNQNFARYALFIKNLYIVTVHDLVRLCFGFTTETISERILLRLDIRGIKRASHIIATSQTTRNDLIAYLKIPDDRISVIYNGLDHSIFKPYKVGILDKPYILYVGSERPRKNLDRLIEAFAVVRKEFPELLLVKVGVAGRAQEYRQEIMRKLESLGIIQAVIFVEYVSELDLAYYYSSAALLAYPSLYEGFGFPPLEAMACGCPVVTSNTSSLPEVVGKAGIMVNPYDTDSLVEAMQQVLTDSKLRDDMVRKGLEQAKKFSWEKAAEETQEVYNKVANG
ncbi:MAG TPA: glycosyltransferase family 4 protein [Dehalococcoidia bacterium]|nr:glycosyltransferase family 4 protein [Dehalococcoidia bacterium]